MSDKHIIPHRLSAGWLLLLALILLLGFGLRAHRLAYDSVWWDEGYSVWMARMSLPEMLFQTSHDTHPPLSYALLHTWRALVGDEEFALRVLSVFCGLLTLALGHQIGREVGGRKVGAASVLLIAVARLPVWWSQEVRMYALATLFAALALWASLRIFTQKERLWVSACLLAVSLIAGLLTLYLFAGVILALNLALVYALWVGNRRWRMLAAWASAHLAALVVFLPWLLYTYGRQRTWGNAPEQLTLVQVGKLHLSTTFLGIATDIERFIPLLGLALAALIGAAVISLIESRREQYPGWVTLLIATLLPSALVYLLALPRGDFYRPTPSPRYFVLFSTPTYVLLAWGAVSLMRRWRVGRWIGAAIIAGFVGLSVWSLDDYYAGLRLTDDYVSMAATLEALVQPDDVVILNNDADWPVFAYHYPHPFERHISHKQRIRDDKYADHLLSPYRQDNQAVWLVQTQYAEVTDPDNYLGQWLRFRAWNWRTYRFPEGQIWFYAMKQERGNFDRMDRVVQWPEAMQPVEAPIAEGVQLVGYTQAVRELRAGELLVVGLGWRVDVGGSHEWPVAVKVLAPDGSEIASTLLPLRSDGSADYFLPVEVFIPPGTPTTRAQVVFAAGETWQPLGTLHIRARTGKALASTTLPDTAQTVNVRFGEAITLVGVDLPDLAAWSPGEAIPLVLYWRAEQPIPERYKVFVHLVGDEYNPDSNNTVWGQQDQEPRGGAATTTGWLIGQLIADDYLVPIWENAPTGRYTLQVGLYLPVGGQRLLAFDESNNPLGDAVTIFEVEVSP